jgi:predicted metal-dependent enzyme (double-stranded beta helix superfamily)
MFFKIMNLKGYRKIKIPFPLIDIYSIKWDRGVQSKIHDHSKYGCIMFLYKGLLKENIYKENIYSNKLDIIKTNIYTAPNITYINDKIGYHDIKSIKESESIHFYFPKGHKTNIYN